MDASIDQTAHYSATNSLYILASNIALSFFEEGNTLSARIDTLKFERKLDELSINTVLFFEGVCKMLFRLLQKPKKATKPIDINKGKAGFKNTPNSFCNKVLQYRNKISKQCYLFKVKLAAILPILLHQWHFKGNSKLNTQAIQSFF